MVDRTSVNQGSVNGTAYPFLSDTSPAADLFLDLYLSFNTDEPVWPLVLVRAFGFGGPSPTVSSSASQSSSTSASDSASDSANAESDIIETEPGEESPQNDSGIHDRDLVVVDSAGTIIADTAKPGVSLHEQPWGDNRYVSQWIGSDFVLRVVWSIDAAATFSGDESFTAPLDPRSCEPLPKRLLRITAAGKTMSGRIRFRNGYNTTLVRESVDAVDGGRDSTSITFAAVPGSGDGPYPGCGDSTPPIGRINGVTAAPGGTFSLIADAGHRLKLPGELTADGDGFVFLPNIADYTTRQAQSAWELNNDNRPCRKCDDFANVYRAAQRTFDAWWDVGQAAQEVGATYHANRDRWLEQRACRMRQPAKLAVFPQPECRVAISASYCNMSPCCVAPVEFRFAFRRFSGGVPASVGTAEAYDGFLSGAITEGEAPYVMGGTWPVLQAFGPGLGVSSSMAVRFRLCLDCGIDDTLEVVMTVHVGDPGTAEDGTPCDLPTADVPVWVTTAWTDAGLATTTAVAVISRSVALDDSPTTFRCDC